MTSATEYDLPIGRSVRAIKDTQKMKVRYDCWKSILYCERCVQEEYNWIFSGSPTRAFLRGIL